MDLITGGLIFYSGWLIYEVGSRCIKSYSTRKFREHNDNLKLLGLDGYKCKELRDTLVGGEMIVELPPGGTVTELESKKEQFEAIYKGKLVINKIPFSNQIEIQIILREVKELEYKVIELLGTKLLIGYDYKGEPLVVNMLETPHLLVTGLSGNGKTGAIRIMIKNLLENKNADVMLLNAFMDDYEEFELDHIENHDSIKEYIEELLQHIEIGVKRSKPLYVVFEELGKVKDKDLIALTTKLLQYGRHNKIYLIGVIQTATKEELKFKSMFNARLTFKQLEESSYRVVLGCGIDEKLLKREFYLFTNDLYKGKTYNLDF